MSLTIGVLKERVEGETRVALTPEIAKKLVSLISLYSNFLVFWAIYLR